MLCLFAPPMISPSVEAIHQARMLQPVDDLLRLAFHVNLFFGIVAPSVEAIHQARMLQPVNDPRAIFPDPGLIFCNCLPC